MLKQHSRFLCLVVALLLIIGGCVYTAINYNNFCAGNTLDPDEIIRLTNEYRVSQGLNELEKDEILCEVAEIRAKEIVHTWSHTRPDGTKFYKLLKDQDYEMQAAGENIGRYQKTADEVMQMWKESKSHNENMLGNYTRIGVAVYQENGNYHFVQIFAR